MKKRLWLFGGFILIGTTGLILLSFGQTGREARRSPINPEFQKYISERALFKTLAVTVDGHGLGEIPAPTEISPVRPIPPKSLEGALPSYYDLRSLSKLTPIKDQGNCGKIGR